MLNRMFKDTYNSKYIRQSDKIQYTLGVVWVLTTVYLLGSSPGYYFFYWVSLMNTVMYAKRFIYFFQYDYQFYMIDY